MTQNGLREFCELDKRTNNCWFVWVSICSCLYASGHICKKDKVFGHFHFTEEIFKNNDHPQRGCSFIFFYFCRLTHPSLPSSLASSWSSHLHPAVTTGHYVFCQGGDSCLSSSFSVSIAIVNRTGLLRTPHLCPAALGCVPGHSNSSLWPSVYFSINYFGLQTLTCALVRFSTALSQLRNAFDSTTHLLAAHFSISFSLWRRLRMRDEVSRTYLARCS